MRELEGFGLIAGLPLGCGGTVYTLVYTCQPLRLTGPSVSLPGDKARNPLGTAGQVRGLQGACEGWRIRCSALLPPGAGTQLHL